MRDDEEVVAWAAYVLASPRRYTGALVYRFLAWIWKLGITGETRRKERKRKKRNEMESTSETGQERGRRERVKGARNILDESAGSVMCA